MRFLLAPPIYSAFSSSAEKVRAECASFRVESIGVLPDARKRLLCDVLSGLAAPKKLLQKSLQTCAIGPVHGIERTRIFPPNSIPQFSVTH